MCLCVRARGFSPVRRLNQLSPITSCDQFCESRFVGVTSQYFNTTNQDQQQMPVSIVTKPKTRKRKSVEVATKYNASIPLEKLTTFGKRVLEVKLAWKSSYGTVFPSDIMYLKDTSTVILPPAPHEKPLNDSRNNPEIIEQYNTYNKDTHNVYNVNTHAVYNTTTDLVISKSDHTLLERDQSFVSNSKESISHRK